MKDTFSVCDAEVIMFFSELIRVKFGLPKFLLPCFVFNHSDGKVLLTSAQSIDEPEVWLH